MKKKTLSFIISFTLSCCSFLQAQNSMIKLGMGVFSTDSESTTAVGELGFEYLIKKHLSLNITATTSSSHYDGYIFVDQTMITPQLRYYVSENWLRSFYCGLALQYHKHNSDIHNYNTMQKENIYSKRMGAAIICGYQLGIERVGFDILFGLKQSFGDEYSNQIDNKGVIFSNSVKKNQVFSRFIFGFNMYIAIGKKSKPIEK
jgi:Protein of unknown function (DUF3575)